MVVEAAAVVAAVVVVARRGREGEVEEEEEWVAPENRLKMEWRIFDVLAMEIHYLKLHPCLQRHRSILPLPINSNIIINT